MGKARILEALGEGRYTIEVIESRERAEAAKQQAQLRVQKLELEIVALDSKISQAQAEVNEAANKQNEAIAKHQLELEESGESSVNLSEFTETLIKAAGKRDALVNERRAKQLMLRADEALIARVNSLPPLRQIQAWCADYTEDLSGEVATAEVSGEIGQVLIKPGFDGGEDSPLKGNQWTADKDGAIQPALSGTPASVFYNLAMTPGWQKWRPTYRTATITSIDGDTCSIELDEASSSQQGLNVNAQSSYSDVPILYMDCNGGAFEENDRVLVAFAGNVEGPTVVGFESEPKSCGVGFDLQHYANWQGFSISFRSSFVQGYPREDPGIGENWPNPPERMYENSSPGTLAYYFRSSTEIVARKMRAYNMSALERYVLAVYECGEDRVPMKVMCQFEKDRNTRYVETEFDEPVVFKAGITYMVASISTYRFYMQVNEAKAASLPHPHLFKSEFESDHPYMELMLPDNGGVYSYMNMWRRSAVDKIIGVLPDATYRAQIILQDTALPPGVDSLFDVINIVPIAINPKGDPKPYVSYS